MIRDYTNDIIKVMIKDLLLDYVIDQRLYCTNDIIKEMIKRFITGLYEWLEFTYTNDIIKVMINDLLLDYMDDQRFY